ncbi:hypothetical protein [Arthrobacter antioxidans]|uniref:hypothetical protein n=1 Tax=Arthrobacter antioxidans TaxID=2895818 RepID=UPI0020001DDE|nr:hypothetical protein [Arthrobacter antioxidans]
MRIERTRDATDVDFTVSGSVLPLWDLTFDGSILAKLMDSGQLSIAGDLNRMQAFFGSFAAST